VKKGISELRREDPSAKRKNFVRKVADAENKAANSSTAGRMTEALTGIDTSKGLNPIRRINVLDQQMRYQEIARASQLAERQMLRQQLTEGGYVEEKGKIGSTYEERKEKARSDGHKADLETKKQQKQKRADDNSGLILH
jgi:hypothetical protein